MVLAVVGSGVACARPPAEPRVGGRSEYDDYAGTATIVRVEKTKRSAAQARVGGGPGYEGYEVRFRFAAKEAVPGTLGQDALKREHLLTLANSWYPGERYLKKYGIRKDKTFAATMSVIRKGVSTPVVFAFETIDTTDYFESKKAR
jgi:hypothetical protein